MDITEFQKKYNYAAATQVMQQYLDIKFANLECMLLFRMGDFYELFYEDATVAAKILGLALTRRGKTGDDEIPMCGVPFHALENYLNKLLEEGFKVAILNYTNIDKRPSVSLDYIVNQIDLGQIERDMKIARDQRCDYIIVYFDWGENYQDYPWLDYQNLFHL